MEKTDVPFLKIKQYISDPLSFSVPHPLKIFEIIILRDKLPKTGVTVCMYASLNYPAPDAGPASDAPPLAPLPSPHETMTQSHHYNCSSISLCLKYYRIYAILLPNVVISVRFK